jgi:hypothetical protein
MDMQDKEFDDVFRAKLDSFETEPSANVWPGIVDELDSAKRRRSLAPWLSIAASVVVLIGVGLFFIPKKTNTIAHLPVKDHLVKTLQPVNTTLVSIGKATQPSPVKSHLVISKGSSGIARVQHNKPITLTPLKSIDTTGLAHKEHKSNEPQLIANVSQPTAVKTPVVPDPTIQLAVKTSIDQVSGLQPDKIANQGLTDNKKDSVLVKRKHKIHNFGDLVNLVVDKLDKRQDKVVQFADDEDGNSHLTGVNLGIVKIKKGE